MVWPLAWLIVLGTLPGLVLGAAVRVVWLIEPSKFKFFVGLVLLYIAGRLAFNMLKKTKINNDISSLKMSNIKTTPRSIELSFDGQKHTVSTVKLLFLTLIVGVIGGAYGIGGGAIIAPFLVAVFGLPIYIVAGAALFGTFVSSIAGVAIYYFLIPALINGQQPVGPDWTLGILFGIGGLLGTYVGARLQRFLPSTTIKIILFLSLAFIAIKYIGGYLF